MKLCPICSNPNTTIWTHPKRKTTYYLCPNCEAIFMDPIHFPTHETELKKYLEHENDLENQGYVNFLENFIDATVVPVLKEGHILDYGSGPNPVLSILLKQRGYNVDIYDPYFHREIPSNIHFDLITSTEVVEHFHEPLTSFEQMVKLLKPKGYLCILTLFHHNDMQHFEDWFYQRDPTHVIFYRPKTLSVLANLLNLELIEHNDYRYAIFRKK